MKRVSHHMVIERAHLANSTIAHDDRLDKELFCHFLLLAFSEQLVPEQQQQFNSR